MTVSETPHIRMFNSDCMEAMAGMEDNAYQLAIVDPPYGLGLSMIDNRASGKSHRKKNYPTIHEIKDWNDNPPQKEYFEQLHRVSKDQIIWGCNYYAEYIPAVGRIYHDKKMRIEGTKINFSHGDLASCSLQKRITVFRYRWSGNKQGKTVNWNNTGPDRRIHPTQKPIALYKWLIKNYATEGDRILDTHGGSGSIAIACYDMGYDLDWYEIDSDYYNDAVERFNKHKAQGKLFEPKQEYNIEQSKLEL